ncbi:hypothetical protein, partial [Klebsiella pneumoniae]|uniref:hypothetical protein n=1 Tax=Klebsiella pneumoniae TaxID=573 RepID=UPI00163DABAD
DENVQPIMQDNRETAPAPAGVTNLRAVSAHANAIEYNLTTGKPYDVHLQIDPRLLDSLYQDPTDPLGEPYVVMWQKASHLAYKNSLPTPEANKQPLRIPRSAFDANGKV